MATIVTAVCANATEQSHWRYVITSADDPSEAILEAMQDFKALGYTVLRIQIPADSTKALSYGPCVNDQED